MRLHVDREQARHRLERAVAHAESDGSVPRRWVEWTDEIGEAPNRTFVTMLGTGLLAKATNPEIDPLSLKQEAGARAYSARGLCHNVLVPASQEFGFHLGATGREPLNNQPFFRYDRVDQMDRVHPRARPSHRRLVQCLREVDRLSAREALEALAAFVRTRMAVARTSQHVDLGDVQVGIGQLIDTVEKFVSEDPEGGRRGQALAAASFDLVFTSVHAQRVNDPSRRYPGDVQALQGAVVMLAAEVRQKVVLPTDVAQFARSLRDAGVSNGVMIALDPAQEPLDRTQLLDDSEEQYGVLVSIVEGTEELITTALMWSGRPLDESLDQFPRKFAERLTEIEVKPASLARWAKLVDM